MESAFTGYLVILISMVLIGVNIHQLWTERSDLEEQVKSFRDAVKEGEVALANLHKVNILFSYISPLAFGAVLYFAGFTLLTVAVVTLKFLFGGYYSIHLQNVALEHDGLSDRHIRSLRIDSVLNIALLSVLLWALVQGS